MYRRHGHPMPDHPRGCGEHLSKIWVTLLTPGSSPRMRGALILQSIECHGLGIIPADAGSTGPAGPGRRPTADHPRGCGEHTIKAVYVMPVRGSSPRMRGARQWCRFGFQVPWIIPADAGSTGSSARANCPGPDHPRGCGEHPAGCGRGHGA